MKRINYTIILFLLTGHYYYAQIPSDTIQNWVKGFYDLSIQKFSENGEWSALRKIYDTNRDTLMVFNNNKPGTPLGYNIGNDYAEFLNNDYLLSSGGNQAELWNLKTQQKYNYTDVYKAEALCSERQFVILDHKQNLKWYTTDGKLVDSLSHVKDLVTNKKDRFYFIKQNHGHAEIYTGYQSKFSKLYTTRNTIFRITLSRSGKRLIAYEKDSAADSQKPIFIDVETGQANIPAEFSVAASEHLYINEVENGKAYFINSYQSVKAESTPIVDVWYGNDKKLEDKFMNHTIDRYWLWNADSKVLQKIPGDQFSKFSDINNCRYFLAFNPDELKDYTSGHADLHMWIYDSLQKDYEDLGIFPASRGKNDYYDLFRSNFSIVNVSENGKLILHRTNNYEWELINLNKNTRQIIKAEDAGRPIFSSDNRYIFFEGNHNLLKYNIGSGQLIPLNIPFKGKTEIINVKTEDLVNGPYNILRYSLDLNKPILLKIVDDQHNKTSYVTYHQGKNSVILNSTPHNIRDLKYNKTLEKFAWLEEDYNMPTRLVFHHIQKKGNVVILNGNIKDKTAVSMHQQTITYQNQEGKELKGTLYYPVNFDPERKYPMIVHIYHFQSKSANHYIVPQYSLKEDGFDIRVLLERGYFVYLPDIIFSSVGVGISALDCVDNALDAINGIRNIDHKKIGLIGHSLGGYETNFIATHSNRFATYISGAGSSDIVRAYFSFSYQFLSPLYWRYENDIYEMEPFANNKRLYFKNSPIYEVENVNAPMLLWAGQKDGNVPADETMEFYIGLKRNNKNVIALFYPNQSHSMRSGSEEAKDLYMRTLQWWDYFLMNKRNVPWIDKQIKKDAN